MLIFGTNFYPFQAGFSIKGKTIECHVGPIPRKLRLTNQQGLEYLNSAELVFAGGYLDERDKEGLRECFQLNPTTNVVTSFPVCNEPGESAVLRAVKLGNWANNGLIFKNVNQNYEIYAPVQGKWQWIDCDNPIGPCEDTYQLDEKERLLVARLDPGQQHNMSTLRLFEYSLEHATWNDLGQVALPTFRLLDWSLKFEENKYLIFANFEGKWGLGLIGLIWENPNKIKEAIFQKLCDIPIEGARSDRFHFWVIGNTLCICWVQADFSLGFFFYNMVQKTIEKDLIFLKLVEELKRVLGALGFKENLHEFANFGVIDWLRADDVPESF
jgi:hypothetical protein